MFRLILNFESEAALADAEKFVWDSRSLPGNPLGLALTVDAEGITPRNEPAPSTKLFIVRSVDFEAQSREK